MYFSNLNIGKRIKNYNSIHKNNTFISGYQCALSLQIMLSLKDPYMAAWLQDPVDRLVYFVHQCMYK